LVLSRKRAIISGLAVWRIFESHEGNTADPAMQFVAGTAVTPGMPVFDNRDGSSYTRPPTDSLLRNRIQGHVRKMPHVSHSQLDDFGKL